MPLQVLPHERTDGIAGLLELLMEIAGKEDLYLAGKLLLEVNGLFRIIEVAMLLGFAKTQEDDVESLRRAGHSPRRISANSSDSEKLQGERATKRPDGCLPHRAIFEDFVLISDQSGFLVASGLVASGFESAVIGGKFFSLP